MSDFHEAYRNGNFGMRRGKITLQVAARWNIAHLMVAFLLNGLALACVIIMAKFDWRFVGHGLGSAFASFSILCGILSLTTAYCGLYLVQHLATLRRPLFFLLLVRLLAFMEILLATVDFCITVAVVANCKNRGDTTTAVIILCVVLAVILVVDCITAMLWLFHWWRCCYCCDCFKSLAIFQPGEPLADGVSDPRTGILSECVYLCWSVYKSDVLTII